MTHLRVFGEKSPTKPVVDTRDAKAISAALSAAGIRYERWPTVDLPSDATPDGVLKAYAGDIARLSAAGGYQKADVVRLTPEHPDRVAMRQKFLDEHRHSEDEVRFFVEGSGAFYLHLGTQVFQVVCERGDLLSVPAGTRHWFDMGPAPRFTAVRLFTNPEGWVAKPTGDAIAATMPRYGE